MPMNTRQYLRWISKNFPPPFHSNVLQTNDAVKNELLSSFQLYSEIRDLGYDILRRNGHTNPKPAYERFQAYVRQGVSFNQAAENLHYRASPLLYYYSFMNFAKAVVFLHNPAFTSGHIAHGLIPSRTSGSLKRHFVTARPGVYSHFYQRITGRQLPNQTKMNIVALLGYVTDVGFDYSYLSLGSSKNMRASFAVAQNNREGGFRGIIAVNSQGGPIGMLSRVMERNFDEIHISVASAQNVFNLGAEDLRSFSFWETKAIYPIDANDRIDIEGLVAGVNDSLAPYLCREPFAGQFLFTINFKLRTPREISMNEFLAIYIIMFYLGSLVRYRPEILEAMLSKKDAWLIENFIRSTPTTFLRHLRNMLDANYLIYAPR